MKNFIDLKGIVTNLISNCIWLLLAGFVGGLSILFFYFRDILFASIDVRVWHLLIIFCLYTCVQIFFIWLHQNISHVKYPLPISGKFCNGEPSVYSKGTKFWYKRYFEYYYIPLISSGYQSVTFADFCGPYCKACDHLLTEDKAIFQSRYLCINCSKRYSAPKELIGKDYKKKLFNYFRTEFEKGHLKENSDNI